jgi:hypothetical protein
MVVPFNRLLLFCLGEQGPIMLRNARQERVVTFPVRGVQLVQHYRIQAYHEATGVVRQLENAKGKPCQRHTHIAGLNLVRVAEGGGNTLPDKRQSISS